VRLVNQADADARAAHEAERQAERKARTKRNAIKRRRNQPKRLPLPPEAYNAKIEGYGCRVCRERPVEAHHIVDKKHFKHDDPMQHHVDNLMPLCEACHVNHTSQMHPVPWNALFEQEQRFVEWARPRHRKAYA